MRALLGMTLLAGALRADFSYTSKVQLSGGGKKPVVSMHLIKGNRMATVTKDHATIVFLDIETIYELDLVKKTYCSMTFAQMKQILDHTLKRAPVSFQVSSKLTGRTKAIGFLSAKEQIATMTLEGAGAGSSQAVTNIFVDSWLLTEPGFGEAEDFRHKLAAKLGYTYASGLSGIGMTKPELLAGLEELAKLSNPVDEMPVETTVRMGGPGSGDLASRGDAAQKAGVVSGTLSRLGGLGRKKTNGRPTGSSTSDQDILIEMTIELSNFSAGNADESKFNVPGGFTEVKPPLLPQI